MPPHPTTIAALSLACDLACSYTWAQSASPLELTKQMLQHEEKQRQQAEQEAEQLQVNRLKKEAAKATLMREDRARLLAEVATLERDVAKLNAKASTIAVLQRATAIQLGLPVAFRDGLKQGGYAADMVKIPVGQWVQDGWHDSYRGAPEPGQVWKAGYREGVKRVLSCGSWYSCPHHVRSAVRSGQPPSSRTNGIGVRLARTLWILALCPSGRRRAWGAAPPVRPAATAWGLNP